MANFELQDLLKTTGQVVQSVGFTAEESANLGEQLAIVAGDVAHLITFKVVQHQLCIYQSILGDELKPMVFYHEADVQPKPLQ